MSSHHREPVEWFADRMEKKLREHDDDRGEMSWREDGCTIKGLFEHLEEEVKELQELLQDGPAADAMDVVHECADVANMAMMIADRVRTRRILNPPVIDAEFEEDLDEKALTP